jgi:group II intron reverse transcriptase/maturase
MAAHGGWLIELDIQAYFEDIPHGNLLEVVRKRVGDGVILRLIGKWLNAGVLEDGDIRRRSTGAPQGGVISPLLSNIYLHEVLDEWFEDVVKPRMRGEATLVRYADDAVMIFEREEDACRVMAVLAKRFAKYGLTLHPEKTKMTDFRRPPYGGKRRRGISFDFLGFTHFWARSRKGTWVVRPKTAKKTRARVIKGLNEWCKRHRHDPLDEQHQQLARKLKGHYGYFGRTGNGSSLSTVQWHTVMTWWKWLNRRSHKARMNWAKFLRKVLQRFPLPAARVTRSVYVTAANP